MINQGLSTSCHVISQGEKAVGAANVQLTATSTPCAFVWVGAPTANHTKGGANTGRILIGTNATTNASGGMPLETTDLDGFIIMIDDASKLYFHGFNANDVVEYQVFGRQ